jgi:hypothetical protein
LVKINEKLPKEKIIGRNLLKKEGIEHDPRKLARIILSLM